jgi:hypothetical protein
MVLNHRCCVPERIWNGYPHSASEFLLPHHLRQELTIIIILMLVFVKNYLRFFYFFIIKFRILGEGQGVDKGSNGTRGLARDKGGDIQETNKRCVSSDVKRKRYALEFASAWRLTSYFACLGWAWLWCRGLSYRGTPLALESGTGWSRD